MNNFPLTISLPDIYAIWDHKWFVKIYVNYYKLSSHDILSFFLKSHLVRKKNYIKVKFSIE